MSQTIKNKQGNGSKAKLGNINMSPADVEQYIDSVQGDNSTVDANNVNVLDQYSQQKQYYLAIFNAIQSSDLAKIDEIFEDKQVKCGSDDLNFNYLHIAALSKNPDILRNLLSKCPDSQELLKGNDKLFGLNVKDFMQFSKAWQTESAPQECNNMTASLMVPNWYETPLCFKIYNTNVLFSILLSSAIVVFVRMWADGKKDYPYIQYGAAVTIATLSVVPKDYSIASCTDYNDYHAINTETPRNFDSLKQFQKHHLDDTHTYVSLDNGCGYSDKIIHEISTPIFNNSVYGGDVFNFTLCGYDEQ